MASMNLRVNPWRWQYATMSCTSWSLTPRITTMLILIGTKPASRAASIPSSTLCSSPPVSCLNVGACRESRLMFRRVIPDDFRSCANLPSREALVLSERSSIPGMAPSRVTISVSSGRTRGSPPVRRIWLTPRPLNTAETRASSQGVSQLSGVANPRWERGRQ